ncbi:MAG: PEP/pyruvate-binding domain-containing protein [Candidatus Latescibacteria bacterium]|nr:PEP/pyruvate-binding domain-containing protein [Candidatus Latescibacterota bacterium]
MTGDHVDLSREPTWREMLEFHRSESPVLYEKIIRHFLLVLIEEDLMTLDELEEQVSRVAGDADFIHWSNPNRPAPSLSESAVEQLRDIVLEKAADLWSDDKLEDLIYMAIKKDLALRLAEMADDPFSSWRDIGRESLEFSKMPIGGATLSLSDAMGTRVALIRRLLSDQLAYLSIAKNVLTIRDFSEIMSRVIGPERGLGKLGGKAAGFILAHDALSKARRQGRAVGEFKTPHTYYIRSDVILDFLKANGLSDLTNIKYREGEDLRRQYSILQRLYRTGRFPTYVIKRLSGILKTLGEVPLVVRSSSLLEDRLDAAFCGKYSSLFVANQGSLHDRMQELLRAVTQVYASVFNPAAIQYRNERGLLDFREEMACIIQPVVGRRIGRYWLPAFAGVAFGSNDYTWSPRLRREDGMVRLVAGLGTRAVDRVGEDYPKLFSPGQPSLRTVVHPDEILRYSQHYVDVVDLTDNEFVTVPLEQLMKEAGNRFPIAQQIFSIYRDGQLIPATGLLFNVEPRDLVVTFDGLLERTGFARQMKEILDVLGETWRVPVDVEFAHDGEHLFILQCRPQSRAGHYARVEIPSGVRAEDRIFSAERFVQMGQVEDIEYVVYVPGEDYAAIADYERLLAVGATIGQLNRVLPHRKFVLMGPGRWGSRGDVKLGVRVDYADINHSRMLLEVARRKGDYVPDVSFGTHFFQDLLEADIGYLPLFPDDAGVIFNEEFLLGSPNSLADLLPARADLSGVVRVIHVPAVAQGRRLDIIMDADQGRALAFLKQA